MGSIMHLLFQLYESEGNHSTAYDASTRLGVKDVSMDSKSNPGMVKLHLKASKTDPFRQGVDILIGKTTDCLDLPSCCVAIIHCFERLWRGPALYF